MIRGDDIVEKTDPGKAPGCLNQPLLITLAVQAKTKQESPFLAAMRDMDTTVFNLWSWQTHESPLPKKQNKHGKHKRKTLRSKKTPCFLLLRQF
jgi:hypothetical protein